MRQLGSSVFDALVAVLVIVAVPAAAINRDTWLVVLAAVALALLAGRIVVERSKNRRGN